MLSYVYVGRCKKPKPNQRHNVLSPRKASVAGYLIYTLKRLCQGCYGIYYHLNHPDTEYSLENVGGSGY